MMKNSVNKVKNMPAAGRALMVVSAITLLQFYPTEVINLYVMGVYLVIGVMAYRFLSQFNLRKEVNQEK